MTGRPARLGGGIASCALGGSLVGLSLPPVGFWPLGPLGCACLYLGLCDRGFRARLGGGFAFGLCGLFIGCFFVEQFSLLGYVALVVFESLFFALAALFVAGTGAWRVASFVGVLSLAEWARDTWPYGGVPIGAVALGQSDGPLVIAGRLGAVVAIVAVTALFGAGLGELFIAARPHHDQRASGFVGLCALVAALVVLLVAALSPSGGPARGTVTVGVVQGGGPRGLSAIDVPASRAFERTVLATQRLRKKVSLIIWPEDTVPAKASLRDSPALAIVRAIARQRHTTMLVGVVADVAKHRFLNEVVMLGPSGKVLGRVEKAHPVPFGEYVPDRAFFSKFANFAAVPRDAIVGRGSGELTSPSAPLAVLISYEDFFPARARSGVRAGGEAIVLATNTASYRFAEAPAEELAASKIEAVSLGRDLAQAATAGYSGLVEANGTVHELSALGTADAGVLRVKLYTGDTIYELLGELPSILICAALVCFGVLRLGRKSGRAQRMSRGASSV